VAFPLSCRGPGDDREEHDGRARDYHAVETRLLDQGRPDTIALMISAEMEQALATGHVVAAVSALGAGAAVLLFPKGTHTHRVIGAVHVLALVLVNVAALSLHRENTFGVFHAFAVVSLVTIAVGLSPFLFGKRSPMVIATHAYCMT
jgi:uncharacterized membrane protein